jgi:amino acid transporter
VRLGPVATDDRPFLVPVVSLAYAVIIGAALLAIDQLAQYQPGAWLEVLGAAVLLLCVLTIALMLRAALRRNREGLRRRALLWTGGAVVPAVLATLAIYSLVESAQTASVISGADTHLTRPLIDSLPRPAGTRLLDERPGLADTETIYQEFSANDLNGIVPFYETRLSKEGWVEDKASVSTLTLRFTKDAFVLAVELNQPPGGYTVTVDHVNANLLPSPLPNPT